MSAGSYDTCALLTSRRVECWGDNLRGQLGNGKSGTNSKGYDVRSATPVRVRGITNATQVSVGWDYACALLSSGKVECWGHNSYGQLGDGKTANSSTPVPVSGIANATYVSAGGVDTCAVLASGEVECWGSNVDGQLGCAILQGVVTSTIAPPSGQSTVTLKQITYEPRESSTPVRVGFVTNATAISSSWYHACAELKGNRVGCWGGGGRIGWAVLKPCHHERPYGHRR